MRTNYRGNLISEKLSLIRSSVFYSALCFALISCSEHRAEAPTEQPELGQVSEANDADTRNKAGNPITPFMDFLYNREGAPSFIKEIVTDATLEKTDKGYEFHIQLTDEGYEEFRGLYRNDGTLDYVIQKEEGATHSWGEWNRWVEGTLVRHYSQTGKLVTIGGMQMSRYFKNGKIEVVYAKSESDVKGGLFDLDYPPLLIPKEVLGE